MIIELELVIRYIDCTLPVQKPPVEALDTPNYHQNFIQNLVTMSSVRIFQRLTGSRLLVSEGTETDRVIDIQILNYHPDMMDIVICSCGLRGGKHLAPQESICSAERTLRSAESLLDSLTFPLDRSISRVSRYTIQYI